MRVFVHPRLGLLVRGRDKEFEVARRVFLAVSAEIRRIRWCLEAPSPAMFQERFCSPPSCLWGSGLDELSCMLQAIRVAAADKGVEKLI